MIGLPFNSDNCLFVANQAVNANQFNSNVPDVSNNNNHTVLWDFVDNKILWVNTLTNIREREIDGLGGIQNESYEVSSSESPYYALSDIPQVFGNNYLLLPAGTYIFDLEFDVYPYNELVERTRAQISAEIRTNTNPALTGADVSDVVNSIRKFFPTFIDATTYPLDFNNSDAQIFNQTVVSKPVTFNAPAIVKSCFYVTGGSETASEAINNIQLRALLVK